MNFFSPFDFPSYTHSPRHYHQYQPQYHHPSYYRNSYGPREDSGYFPSNINLEALRRERELEELQRERQRNAYYAELQRERQREAELQEQYLRQRQEALRRKEFEKQEALRKRRILLLTYTIAAKKIQRAFRAYREKELEAKGKSAVLIQRVFREHLKKKQEHSAIVLQRAFQRFHSKLEGIKIQKKLKELVKYNSELLGINETAGKKVFTSSSVFGENGQLTKDYLFYEDSLLKLLIKLDGVTTDGFDIIRERRKELVQEINASFKKLDVHKKECEKINMQVDKNDIQDEEMKDQEKEEVKEEAKEEMKEDQQQDANQIQDQIQNQIQNQDEEMKEVQKPQVRAGGKRHKKKKASKQHQKLKPMELEETNGINSETTGK